MRTILAFLAALSATLASAQSGIPVHLDPTSDSPQIGILESSGELVPAEWPSGTDAQPGWQPVRYRGAFEVYVDNNDIGKDVSPKPGSLYYLEPSRDAPKLGVAAKNDKADILTVDTYFCKLRLETTVVGYVPTAAIQALISLQTPQPRQGEQVEGNPANAVKELRGILQRTGMITRNRTGLSYKLNDLQGRVLALVDLSGLPDLVHVEDYLNEPVRLVGTLEPNANGGAIILVAQSLKKAN